MTASRLARAWTNPSSVTVLNGRIGTFDLDKLEAMWMPIKYGRYAAACGRQDEWERRYYLTYGEIMTLEELAKEMEGAFD